MSLGTLTAAKILLRTPPRVTGDDFNPEAWTVLDARADELAAVYYHVVSGREEYRCRRRPANGLTCEDEAK